MNRRVNEIIAAALLVFAAAQGRCQTTLPPLLRTVGFDQRIDEQLPLDLAFVDEFGRSMKLDDCFRGKPVILVLVQYRCKMLCSEILNGLVRCLLDMPFEVGKEFDIITVSFDPSEGPELAAGKKDTYLKRYAHAGSASGWHFLTGSQQSIARLTEAVGFRYTYDRAKEQFAHASGIVVLTPRGKTYRYFLDVAFVPRDLKWSLIEASENKIGSTSDQALLFCYKYDPDAGKYGIAVMNVVRTGGVLTVLGIIGMVLFLRRRGRQAAAAAVR